MKLECSMLSESIVFCFTTLLKQLDGSAKMRGVDLTFFKKNCTIMFCFAKETFVFFVYVRE